MAKAAAKKTEDKPKAKKVSTPKKKAEVSTKSEDTKPSASKKAGRSCRITNCKRVYRAKGYCKLHYKQWRQGAFGRARYKTCKEVGCRSPQARNRHGYCEDHFQNYYVKGIAKPVAPAPEKPKADEKAA